MFDNATTRFPRGLNASSEAGIFSDMPLPDRIAKIHEYPQDFDQYIAADYVLTLNGGTVTNPAGDGGVILLTTVVSNFVSVQKTPAAFQNTKGFRTWFQAAAQVDNVLGFLIAGLLNATATPFTPASQSDGFFFTSGAAGALTANVAVGAVIVSVPMGVNLVAAAYAKLGIYYDGGVYAQAPLGRVIFEAKGAGVTASSRVSIPIPASGTIAAFPGAVNLSPIVGVNASTAAIRTMLADFFYAAKDRDNINATPAF